MHLIKPHSLIKFLCLGKVIIFSIYFVSSNSLTGGCFIDFVLQFRTNFRAHHKHIGGW